ncbi:hypothetical protein [Shouchella lehensis]|uniref:Tetratricopeptide repeat protein n=1 Tax=Shouchella lehensis TaxID=300825 RepID=A0A4Y7WQU7_9BACI|nr:hypothetical protein [Shouchella lehensis]MBG9783991.1 hypothetical protein [Shouchella lehensis]TES51036.1 hypothetical protein E2L03_03690 [Shouchella lehensis]
MKDKKQGEDKIILFPGLVKRLVEEGMNELKQKHAEKAYQLFAEASSYDQGDPQARFGTVLSLIELNRQQEAVMETEKLLNEGIGHYFEILQVHVSLLVQLSRYDQVVHLLEAVLSEDKIPAKDAETFYELLHFSRQMSESNEYSEASLSKQNQEETMLELKAGLHAANEPAKWNALQTVRKLGLTDLTDEIRSFVLNKQTNPLMRTYALQLLHEWGDRKPLRYERDHQVVIVTPSELEEPGERQVDQAIRKALEDQLEQEDPTLLHMAKQLHHTYLLMTYPFELNPENPKAWACAFHLVAAEQLGLETDETTMMECYECERFDVLSASDEIEALEQDILLEAQNQNEWFHT